MSRMTTTTGPLRAARLRAGMTQAALSERTNRSQAFISRVENGDVGGTREFYVNAAAVLECEVSDLVEEGVEPTPSRKREE